MPAPRKNFDVAVEMYTLGASVEDCADAFGISRQAMWKALARRKTQMRPNAPIGRANHFFVHGQGYGAEKLSAKLEVLKAVKSGRLERQPCEVCLKSPRGSDGRSLVHAHHDDYSSPLLVRWLCVACHFQEHHK